jgi:hypothetical protein
MKEDKYIVIKGEDFEQLFNEWRLLSWYKKLYYRIKYSFSVHNVK